MRELSIYPRPVRAHPVMRCHLLPIIVLSIATALMAIELASTSALAADTRSEPVRLIFDTDICGDCDDVLALGMIHSLESRGHAGCWP